MESSPVAAESCTIGDGNRSDNEKKTPETHTSEGNSYGDAGPELYADDHEYFYNDLMMKCSSSPSDYNMVCIKQHDFPRSRLQEFKNERHSENPETHVNRWRLMQLQNLGNNGGEGGRSQHMSAKGVRLGSAWTYWLIVSQGSELDWKEGMKPMCTFDYKEQFWGMWNAVKPPSELMSKRELALFRGGFGRRPVWPDWNDSENVEGGRWKIMFKVTELPQIIDNFWRDLMVHCIEERWVPYSGLVNGVSITVKGQFYRIYIWLCSSRPACIEFIRDRAKELLKDIPCIQMEYVTGNGERVAVRSPAPQKSSETTTTALVKIDFSKWNNNPDSYKTSFASCYSSNENFPPSFN